MGVCYNKLWKLLIDKGLNKSALKQKSGISSVSIAKLGKNKSVTTTTLVKICRALDCNISDIVELGIEEEAQ